MLVLSRELEQAIRIGPDIWVRVLGIDRGRVKLGVEAPRHVEIWRAETLSNGVEKQDAEPTADR